MKLRIAFICVIGLALISCKDKNAELAKKEAAKPPKIAPKVDLYKAALLNVEMGKKYLDQGDMTRAKKKLVHALELQPKLPEAHSAIAYFYERVGDMEEAEEHHSAAISFGNNKGRYLNNYGTFLCRQKRYKEADRAFKNALQDKTYLKTAEVYANAGVCILQQPEPDMQKAYSYLQSALQHDPNTAVASLELANIELERRNFNAVIKYLSMYKAASNATPRSLWLGIQAYKKLGRQDELASAVLQLKNIFPDSQECKDYDESVKNE